MAISFSQILTVNIIQIRANPFNRLLSYNADPVDIVVAMCLEYEISMTLMSIMASWALSIAITSVTTLKRYIRISLLIKIS